MFIQMSFVVRAHLRLDSSLKKGVQFLGAGGNVEDSLALLQDAVWAEKKIIS